MVFAAMPPSRIYLVTLSRPPCLNAKRPDAITVLTKEICANLNKEDGTVFNYQPKK